MTKTIPATEESSQKHGADRLGVFLSVLCAIHCALTPPLLILLPTFGKMWSHPASHWGMALFVVPIAVFMLRTGYLRHGRKWIVATGTTGVILVIIGAILPYVETSAAPHDTEVAAESAEVKSEEAEVNLEEEEVFTFVVGELDSDQDDDVFVYVKGEEMPETSCTGCQSDGGCQDNCCPSLVTDENGNVRLHVPPASIVTTLGGLSLIITHIGNLRCCPACRRRRSRTEPS